MVPTNTQDANKDNAGASHPSQSQNLAFTTTSDKPVGRKSTIGKGLLIKGELTAHEDMVIDGRIEGTISLKNNRLEITQNSHTHAHVFAKVIVIDGEIKGDVHATEQVVVTKHGRVFGNVFSSDISIEDGALLKGRIDMGKKEEITIPSSSSMTDLHEDSPKGAPTFGSFLEKMLEKAHLHPTGDMKIENRATALSNEALKKEMPAALNAPEKLLGLPVLEKDAMTSYLSDVSSWLGETVRIKGEIISEENVQINGHVDGVIYFKNHALEIGAQGQIKANIFVKSLCSAGNVKGDIYASDQIAIKKSGHVYGKILSPRIHIESGAVLMGSLEMDPQNIEKIFEEIVQHSHAHTAPSKTDAKMPVNNINKVKKPGSHKDLDAGDMTSEKFRSLLNSTE